MRKPKLLTVDDDPGFRTFVRTAAEDCGFDVVTVATGGEFRAVLARSQVDGFVLDLSMPETDGIEILRYLADMNARAPILIVSGFAERIRDAALRLGTARGLVMVGVLAKPVRAVVLKAKLLQLMPSDRV